MGFWCLITVLCLILRVLGCLLWHDACRFLVMVSLGCFAVEFCVWLGWVEFADVTSGGWVWVTFVLWG